MSKPSEHDNHLEKVAQLWCLPRHENKPMDVELASDMALLLDSELDLAHREAWKHHPSHACVSRPQYMEARKMIADLKAQRPCQCKHDGSGVTLVNGSCPKCGGYFVPAAIARLDAEIAALKAKCEVGVKLARALSNKYEPLTIEEAVHSKCPFVELAHFLSASTLSLLHQADTYLVNS